MAVGSADGVTSGIQKEVRCRCSRRISLMPSTAVRDNSVTASSFAFASLAASTTLAEAVPASAGSEDRSFVI